jgi:acetoin utilization protein AcuB
VIRHRGQKFSVQGENEVLVKEMMSQPVVKIYPEMTTHEALDLMRINNIRHLPVVNRQNHLIGIVSESDLLYDSPSDVVDLVAWEINYFGYRITVDEVMTREVLTVGGDESIEALSLIMAENQIKCLPVVHDNEVVGIITDTDLLKDFPELLRAREPGIHVDVLVPNHPGELAKLTKAISDGGGYIVALEAFSADRLENREVSIKVAGVNLGTLKKLIEPLITRFIDIHEWPLPENVEMSHISQPHI